MANPKGNPQNLKRVPKGGPSPNPNGRPPDALNAAMKKLTKLELEELAAMIIKGNLKELQAIGKDPKSSVLRVWIAAIAVKSIQKGDMGSLDTLLNRLVGKVKDNHHFTGDVAPATVVNVTIPSNGRGGNDESNNP